MTSGRGVSSRIVQTGRMNFREILVLEMQGWFSDARSFRSGLFLLDDFIAKRVDGWDRPTHGSVLISGQRYSESGFLATHYSTQREDLERNQSIQQQWDFNLQFQTGARTNVVRILH